MAKRLRPQPSNPANDKKTRELQALEESLSQGNYQHVVDVLNKRIRTGKKSPSTLYLMGLAWLGLKDAAQGARYLKESIALGGNTTAAEQQLARAYFLLGHFSDADTVLQQLIKDAPGHVEYWRNRILALEGDTKIEQGLLVCQQAIEQFPMDASLHRQLGDLYHAQEKWPEAASAYRRCFELDATREDAIKRYVAVLRRMGDRDAIRDALGEWLRVAPDNPVAQHLRGAYEESSTPSRASDEYVREVFDQFAETFDVQLSALDYRAPQCVADQLKALQLPVERTLHVLDAGCGTGLLGQWLRPYAAHLTGVDLSSQMLSRASRLELYDALETAELTAFLNANANEFDLIASADTMNYFGELRPFCIAARSALRPAGGWLVFTLESHSASSVDNALPAETTEQEFTLQASGRYTHAIDKVISLLSTNGFVDIQAAPCILRQEAGKGVNGVVISCHILP